MLFHLASFLPCWLGKRLKFLNARFRVPTPISSHCVCLCRIQYASDSARTSEGWFLKKYFWENIAAVLRRTATLPGNFWENCGAVLMRTNVEISWWFLKWVLMRNSVRFLGRTCIRGGSYENQRVWENQAAVLMRTNPINQWWFLNEVLPANGGS